MKLNAPFVFSVILFTCYGAGVACSSDEPANPDRNPSSSSAGTANGAGTSPGGFAGNSSAGSTGVGVAGSTSSGGGGDVNSAGREAGRGGEGGSLQTGGSQSGSQAGTANGGSGSSAGPLAARPYLGWSSWSSLVADPREAKVKAIADAVAEKLLPHGYEYINIDDGWYDGIDANGYWKTSQARIPSGIKGLADYVHGKGLKLGLYLVPGLLNAAYDANVTVVGTSYKARDIVTSGAGNTNTKENRTHKLDFSKPGAVQFIEGHAKLLADWGVDFVKLDFVGPGGGGGSADNQADVKQWRAALDKTGRKIWLELSNKLDISAIATWKGYSNGWRVASDIEVYNGKRTDWAHVKREIDALPPFVQHAGPGHWNDLDSTEIGNGDTNGITPTERQTHFAYWAINCAPIYLGTDPTNLDPDDLKILTNDEILAVHQAGIPARPVSTASTAQVWFSKQSDGSVVVGLFNFGNATATISVDFGAVGAGATMKVRDLVSHTDLGPSSGSFGASIPAHGSRTLRLTPG